MMGGLRPVLAVLRRPRVLLPLFLLLLILSGLIGYVILLFPGGVLMRWAQAAMPEQITMISLGPYPEEKDFRVLQRERVKYIVSLLDPRLPYEKQLIEREKVLADKYGMTLKVFPMASIFDRQIFPDYEDQRRKAVQFLRHLDGPAFVHCYLGKHRVLHVRDELAQSGVPRRYWTPAGSSQEYWSLLSRIDEAKRLFHEQNYAKVLEILREVKVPDVDVTFYRGWAHYRLGFYEEALADFRLGLTNQPDNPRNLLGLGYCYLQQGQPVMAQRQFSAILEQIPDEEGALVGMGLAHLRLQNRHAAAQMFRKALAANPENGEAKLYLRQAEAE
jgi:tetratricopeptide (TPR) repeat protein